MTASEANKSKCKRYREANRETYLESHRVWRANNREKLLAQGKARRAVKAGRLIKSPCQVCGNVQSEAHHADYSKPLDVRWLCTPPAHTEQRDTAQPILMSDGSPMNPESVKRSNEGWKNSVQGRALANRKSKTDYKALAEGLAEALRDLLADSRSLEARHYAQTQLAAWKGAQ